MSNIVIGQPSRRRGFTLIELLVVLAILGILGAIAYPSYTSYIKKGNRAAAQAVLMEISQKQTQYLLDNRAYASAITDLQVSVPDKVTSLYDLSITVGSGSPPTFTATATPKSGTQQAGDDTLSITNTGQKTPADKW